MKINIKSNISKFLNLNISINYCYYFFSLIVIAFVYFKQELYNYEFSRYNLILFVLIFTISVYFENKRNNIFLKILIFYCFVFFIFMIPFSIIFKNNFFTMRNVEALEVSKSILILSFQYISLFLTLYIVNPSINITQKKIKVEEINFILNLLIVLCVANFIFNKFSIIDYESYLKFFAVFFNIFDSTKISFVFTILLFFVILKKYEINNLFIKAIIFYSFYLLDVFLAGSRSVLFHIALVIFLSLLYYTNIKKIKLKQVIIGFIVGNAMVIAFFLSTHIRKYIAIKNFGINNELGFISIVEEAQQKFKGTYYIDRIIEYYIKVFGRFFDILKGITDRMSYIDFYIEKINNSSYYIDYINITYYLKSFIDRVTPGFDLYNIPLASKVFQQIYRKKFYAENNLGEYTQQVTNSEQLTIFAESHILFWYFSPIYYLSIFYILKIILRKIDKLDGLSNKLFNLSILLIFFDWLTCFGLDMFAMLTFYHIFFILCILMSNKINNFYKK